MSRLGDLILLERTRQKLTRKQVARKCGVSEGYIKDVEEGRRIIQDDQARRILKTLGTSQRNEAEFSLDEIAATVDLGTLAPAKPAPQKAEAPKPAPRLCPYCCTEIPQGATRCPHCTSDLQVTTKEGMMV